MRVMKTTLTLITAALLSGCAAVHDPLPQGTADRLIYISDHGSVFSDTAGGYGYRLRLGNLSGEDIKYVEITITALNRVGDPAPDRISGKATRGIRVVGPIAPRQQIGRPFPVNFGPGWYDNGMACGRIDKIEVTWMNGLVRSFEGKELAPMVEQWGCRHAVNGLIFPSS